MGCSPYREHLEKWLIQFWSPLLMADVIGYMPFPEFFSIGNNNKYCSISGVFSVLGVPRKVIDTVLESSTHGILFYMVMNWHPRGHEFRLSYSPRLSFYGTVW